MVRELEYGSFVAHVASFREIEILDVRPLKTDIPGVVFRQADLMDENSLVEAGKEYCDSLSCLHALEHFGLGRYGDPINPLGYQSGILNMARILKEGGTFYLSTPIGRERVLFNANWIFAPKNIVYWANVGRMRLKKLIIIKSDMPPTEFATDDSSLEDLELHDYQFGLFIFKKY